MKIMINNILEPSPSGSLKFSRTVILRSGATKESFKFYSKSFFHILLETTEIAFLIACAGAGVSLIQQYKLITAEI